MYIRLVKFLQKIIRSAVLGVVSLSSLFGAQGSSSLVLCMGNDGHLELESSVNGKCGTVPKAEQATAMHASDTESHCGTCMDVTLIGSYNDSIRSTNEFFAPELKALAYYEIPLFQIDRATAGLLPMPPPLENLHLVQLRTVLLLV
jgi:hypothetical protein